MVNDITFPLFVLFIQSDGKTHNFGFESHILVEIFINTVRIY